MPIYVNLSRSNIPSKKFKVTLIQRKAPASSKHHGRRKTVHFGAKGMSDFTIHKDPKRKARYIARHKARENWSRSGIMTPGFWSRWLLWNKPSLQASLNDIKMRFFRTKTASN